MSPWTGRDIRPAHAFKPEGRCPYASVAAVGVVALALNSLVHETGRLPPPRAALGAGMNWLNEVLQNDPDPVEMR